PLSDGSHTIQVHVVASPGTDFTVTYHLWVGEPPRVVSPDKYYHGKTLAEWLTTYWRWFQSGANPAQGQVGSVQLLPLPAGDMISGSGTPADPALLKGRLEITLQPGTSFVLPAFALTGESYNNGTPDDTPLPDATVLAGVHPNLMIDGKSILSDAN